MVYKFKSGSRLHGDAQGTGERLEAIRNTNAGILNPGDVVAAARDDDVLSRHFEWDDERAGKQYRLHQARHLINCIVIKIDDGGVGDSIETRAFVNIRQEDEDRSRAYTTIQVAMSDNHLRPQVIDQALRELIAWKRRYSDLRALEVVFAAIDQVAKSA